MQKKIVSLKIKLLLGVVVGAKVASAIQKAASKATGSIADDTYRAYQTLHGLSVIGTALSRVIPV